MHDAGRVLGGPLGGEQGLQNPTASLSLNIELRFNAFYLD